jgi:tRNA U34 5-methylaminomethyl-2-thiouridine-forming methyltransferase MnmC
MEEIFFKLFRGLKPGGILVTYCVKGTVVRAMRSVGFTVEKLPGPPGKRHILRAVKTSPC